MQGNPWDVDGAEGEAVDVGVAVSHVTIFSLYVSVLCRRCTMCVRLFNAIERPESVLKSW